MREECKNLIASCDRWLTSLIDQMLGHDTVGGRDITRKEWRDIGIRCVIRKNPAYEAIAKRLRIGRKALGGAEFVALEAICDDGQIFPLEPFAHSLDIVRRDFNASPIVQWQ